MQKLAKFGIRVCQPFYSLSHSVLTAQGLASNPLYHLSTQYLNRNYGGMLYFTLKATTEASVCIFDKFKLVSRGRLVNLSEIEFI
jgi:O-acetylhomoserine/O-acetylserine sulfhydrylase-like pyridoxal-dependent enzyme